MQEEICLEGKFICKLSKKIKSDLWGINLIAASDASKIDKNSNYWGGEPAIDHIELKIMDDVDALNMALQNGEIDMIAQLPAASASLFSDTDTYTIGAATSTRSQFLQFNLESEALKDVNIRKAISMCIDREGYADVVFAGYAKPSYGIYPDTLSYGGTDGINLSVDKYDTEAAKALVEAAGYTPEKPLELKLVTYSYNTGLLQMTDMLQPELEAIGIKLSIETYDVLDDVLQAGNFDIAALSYAKKWSLSFPMCKKKSAKKNLLSNPRKSIMTCSRPLRNMPLIA